MTWLTANCAMLNNSDEPITVIWQTKEERPTGTIH